MVRKEATTVNQAMRGVLAGVLLLGAGGCFDVGYALSAAGGQLHLVSGSVPLSAALRRTDLTAEQIGKLELIADVRQFARDELTLVIAGTYTRFYDSGGVAVAYNVSASRQDALEPYQWWFPIVGFLPYLGYFDPAAADAETRRLEALGYDVYRYEIDAYNLGPGFENPILSPMLKRSAISLVDTVIHELLHNTVWGGSVTFNESMATWAGRTGAVQYYRDRDPQAVATVLEVFEDADRVAEFMLEFINRLQTFYDSDRTSSEKVREREVLFQEARDRFAAELQPLLHHPGQFDWVSSIPTNNAFALGLQRYRFNLELFEAVFDALEGDWPGTLQVFSQAAAAEDSFGYLRDWLADRG